MTKPRFIKNHDIDGWPIEDTKFQVVIDKNETISSLNKFSKENEKLKFLLQLCVNDMYSSTGKIKKHTAIKLMEAIRVDLVKAPD